MQGVTWVLNPIAYQYGLQDGGHRNLRLIYQSHHALGFDRVAASLDHFRRGERDDTSREAFQCSVKLGTRGCRKCLPHSGVARTTREAQGDVLVDIRTGLSRLEVEKRVTNVLYKPTKKWHERGGEVKLSERKLRQ